MDQISVDAVQIATVEKHPQGDKQKEVIDSVVDSSKCFSKSMEEVGSFVVVVANNTVAEEQIQSVSGAENGEGSRYVVPLQPPDPGQEGER